VASKPKIWLRPRSRPQSFGLGLGLKHLASSWPRSAAEEPAAKRRQLLFSCCRPVNSQMIEDSCCAREWEIKCVVLIMIIGL